MKPQPLPLGATEFDAWSDRIIAGAMVDADHASQKFALADSITHLGSLEDHREDAYFIKYLRKVAANQVAVHMRDIWREEAVKAHKAKKAAEAAQQAGEVTPTKDGDPVVLEKPSV